jgi:hypothetical protein
VTKEGHIMERKWTYGMWGAAVGAILTLILGFFGGGWQTTSAANRMANELSEKSVIAALAPFCVDRFRTSADAAQSAELLKFTTNYERGSFLEKAGYTSLPGSTESNWRVGRACGDLLAAAPKK